MNLQGPSQLLPDRRNSHSDRNAKGPRLLRALMVTPNQRLTQEFRNALPGGELLNVVSELPELPSPESLRIGVDHFHPDLIFLDISKSPIEARELVSDAIRQAPGVPVIVLNSANDADLVVSLLRAGVMDYFYPPFQPESILTSLTRLQRRLQQQEAELAEAGRPRGRVLAFSSAKPGSGASTLAAQTAFTLRRITGEKVLLADLDLVGGTSNAWIDLRERRLSFSHLLKQPNQLNSVEGWKNATVCLHGVDLLASPDQPVFERPSPEQIHEVLHLAREFYDWIVIDLPTTATADASVTLALADEAFLVTTAELPSLHMARRQLQYLDSLGLSPQRLRFVLNRVQGETPLPQDELEKNFRARIAASFPNDYFAIHAAGSAGHPLLGEGKLSRSIRDFVGQLVGTETTANPDTKAQPFTPARQPLTTSRCVTCTG